MEQENFDKKMEDWAASEAKAAPELRPTAEMYRLVESKDEPVQKSWFQQRWVIPAGLALTALIFLIIGGVILRNATPWFGPAPVQQISFVELRKGPDIHPETPEKGKGRGAHIYQQLTFQVHYGVPQKIESFDLRNPLTKSIALTSTDDFRLLIQPSQPSYLYIYLVSPNNEYQALHPETGFNPLHPVVTTLLPAHLNWFYLSGENGAYRLLLITATQTLPELDERYDQYVHNLADPHSESFHNALSAYLESLTMDPTNDIETWELSINLQN
jgi:hypothetical protein